MSKCQTGCEYFVLTLTIQVDMLVLSHIRLISNICTNYFMSSHKFLVISVVNVHKHSSNAIVGREISAKETAK